MALGYDLELFQTYFKESLFECIIHLSLGDWDMEVERDQQKETTRRPENYAKRGRAHTKWATTVWTQDHYNEKWLPWNKIEQLDEKCSKLFHFLCTMLFLFFSAR